MARIEQQYLLNGCTPEQILLISWFYSQFDYAQPGINRHIVNVEPVYFQNAVAGTEFLVYAATKLYICFDFWASQPYAGAALSFVTIRDEANAVCSVHSNESGYWDIPAALSRFVSEDLFLYNFYFSRLEFVNYLYIKFNGYRITLD